MRDGLESDFASLLRRYRRRALLSQERLAALSGLAVRTIRDLEKGSRTPRYGSVRCLADALALTATEYAQLTGAAADRNPEPTTPVRQLPQDLSDFIGRAAEVAMISAALLDAGAAVPVVMLAGRPGVGKTALGVHVAHRLAPHFPDGQLYADLRAGSDQVTADGVLHRFLRALGMEAAAIPADPDERQTAYRSLLGGRRILIVLDDAGREAQVRPLLPGTTGCAVLVTGRFRLAGLAGARSVDVDVPARDEALGLLTRLAGATRVDAEPQVASDIIDRCGGLPLAVRIVGARLARRPRWPLHRVLDLLEDERGRLDQLAVGDLGVRSSLALSYRAQPEPVRRAFRLLGLAAVGEFSPWLLAPLLDLDLAAAEQLIDQLVDACLVDNASRPHADRYRLHDLVRVYARECADEVEPRERRAALERLTGCWLALCEAADGRLPTTSDVVTIGSAVRWRPATEEVEKVTADPLRWFDLERDNLVAAVLAAADADLDEAAWELVGTMRAWLVLHNDWAAFDTMCPPVVDACRRAGNHRGEAVMTAVGYLANKIGSQRIEPDHLSRLEWASALFERLGDRRGHTAVLSDLASVHVDQPELSYDYAVQALRVARRIPHPSRELVALGQLSLAAEKLGRSTEAAAGYERALVLARKLGATENEAYLLWRLAVTAINDRRGGDAIDLLQSALALTRRIGNRIGEVSILTSLADTLLDSGRAQEAEVRLDEALAVWPREDQRFDPARLYQLVDRLRKRDGGGVDANVG